MGDMADYSLSTMDFAAGHSTRIRRYKCNRCGMGGLVWLKTKEGWRLFEVIVVDDGVTFKKETYKQHVCEQRNDGK